MEAWQARSVGQGSLDSDMPDFSFAPQEYITQIGEYDNCDGLMDSGPYFLRSLRKLNIHPLNFAKSSISGMVYTERWMIVWQAST